MKKMLLISVAILALAAISATTTTAVGALWWNRMSTTRACINRHSGMIHVPSATRDAKRKCDKNELSKIRLVIVKGR